VKLTSRLFQIVIVVAATAAALASSANASQLVDRNAKDVRLAVNAKGEALLTYTAHGRVRHVLAWGGMNAIAPTQTRPQVAIKLDYAGGWGKYRTNYWKTFHNACRAYQSPKLAWFVAGCTAPDGSYWALQAWQRMLPNYGATASPTQAAWELRLSHWTGALPVLEISTDWAWHQWDHLYGTFTYNGAPVYGFKATPGGNPLDSFGRNIYVDTFDSVYGKGWRRENSFLTHTGTGVFCYSVNPHGSRPAGQGEKYRATVEGPGATPDVMWEGNAPGRYDQATDSSANDAIGELGDRQCRGN
jgi:hypothetical protein